MQLCRPHFRTASLLPLNRTAAPRISPSYPPSIVSLSLSLCSTKSSFARLYTPLFPLVILPVLLFFPGNFPCFSFIFFLFLFLVFARVPYLSPPSFLFPRLFIYAAFSVLHSPRCFLDELLFIPPDYVLLMCSNELRSFLFLFLLPPLMQRRCNRVNSRGNRSERRLLPFWQVVVFLFFFFFFVARVSSLILEGWYSRCGKSVYLYAEGQLNGRFERKIFKSESEKKLSFFYVLTRTGTKRRWVRSLLIVIWTLGLQITAIRAL